MASVSTECQSTCQALHLSDGQPCKELAVAAHNLFCRFHAKQCHALYTGYKRRNRKLDALADQPPEYLRDAETPLANDDFRTIDDKGVLQAVHDHLFELYVLLGKVIDARKLHHKHFYPLNLDYGHQAYLDSLTNRRHVVLRALERVEMRTAELLYEKEKWYDWVRTVQEEDEINREKEQKRVKAEAAMFRRHYQNLQARLQAQRKKDEEKRQEAYLDALAQERRASVSPDEEEDIGDWDPIEDEEDNRQYIDLIRHFLWLELLNDAEPATSAEPAPASVTEAQAASAEGSAKKPKPKKKPKSKTAKAAPDSSQAKQSGATGGGERLGGQDLALATHATEADNKIAEPQKANIETEADMRTRLATGVPRDFGTLQGAMLVGSFQNPHETLERSAPLTQDEINDVARDIREIKQLLFCRILLSQPALLRKAVKANSIHEFLEDPELVEVDLRDLCLKLEKPSLQDLRDACADLFRGDEPEDEEPEDEVEEEIETVEEVLLQMPRHQHLSDPDWLDDKLCEMLPPVPRVDVKRLLGPPEKAFRKMKIRVCGRTIWNYSSEKSMPRRGWLHFSIMAKDCPFNMALSLCRNWDEFAELNFLCSWQYFPASNWINAGADKLMSQLNELNFFPFFKDFSANQRTHHHEIGSRQRGARRQHSLVETRNVIVGHMKRNDPVTRRFIQYCIMRAGEVLIMVRDGKTGKVITAPDREHLWTWREKQGLGRSSKSEWTNRLEVGPLYFLKVDLLRKFYLEFDDYYEVWLWDFVPGENPMILYHTMVQELRKASRMTKLSDMYLNKERFLRSVTREEDTQRVRDIKPGEVTQSMWDIVTDPSNQYVVFDSKGNQQVFDSGAHAEHASLFYSEADAAEDMVLFPDELTSAKSNALFKEISNPITKLELGNTTWIQYLAKRLKNPKALDEGLALEMGMDFESESSASSADEEGSEDEEGHIWELPRIWKRAAQSAALDTHSPVQKRRLQTTTALANLAIGSFENKFEACDRYEVADRDRGIGLKKGLHLGDLEPGAQEKYEFSRRMVDSIKDSEPADAGSARDLFWFIAEIRDWLQLQAEQPVGPGADPTPWAHSFIIQDLVEAVACMAPFFRGIDTVRAITDFLDSEAGSEFRDSALFRQQERAQTIPDRRTRLGFRSRPKSFWKEWQAILDHCKSHAVGYVDQFPPAWSTAIRPIIAQLYRAGVIAPAHVEPHPAIVPGYATANTEPHRPGKLDLFIDYADRHGASGLPPGFAGELKLSAAWPALLPFARDFAAAHGRARARFAVLRIWSAPHYYPLMIGLWKRPMFHFLDPVGRAWQWKFVPKDFDVSEGSMHQETRQTVARLRPHLAGPDRVQHRGDVVLVLGTDAADLLRSVVATAFAVQTQPWVREIDLWKSFVNVDLDFLEGLDPWWLD